MFKISQPKTRPPISIIITIFVMIFTALNLFRTAFYLSISPSSFLPAMQINSGISSDDQNSAFILSDPLFIQVGIGIIFGKAIFSIVMAFFVFKRQNWSRISYTVFLVIVLFASNKTLTLSMFSIVIISSYVVSVVLLYLPTSNRWFKAA